MIPAVAASGPINVGKKDFSSIETTTAHYETRDLGVKDIVL